MRSSNAVLPRHARRLTLALALLGGIAACSDPPPPAAATPPPPAAEPAAPPAAPTPVGTGVSETGIDLSQVMATPGDTATTAADASQDPALPATGQDPALPASDGSVVQDGSDIVIDPLALQPETPATPAAIEATLARDSPLRAQVLLERAFFSPGEIDGVAGSNQARAVTAYQKAQDLPATGQLDAATWEKLDADTAPILVEYTLTEEDVAGPFREIPSDTMAKAKLDALPYASVEEALGEKFHASPALLKKLNPDADFTTAGTTIAVPNIESGNTLPVPARLVVSKSLSALQLVDESGKVLGQFPVTTGSARFPLPIGEWKINGVGRNPVWHFDPKLIAGSKKTDRKARIPAGPNNPVGTTWIDLSKEHYGIHGTPEPAKIGKSESNGCIRMTNWSVQALAAVVKPGMLAVLEQ